MPDQLKVGIELLSGMALDNVKVHFNSSKPAQLNAHAYTRGTDIYIARGREQHLAHEAWHVVQQTQGRVRPTTSVNGTAVNDDQRLEAEATSMGRKAAQTTAAPVHADQLQRKSFAPQQVAQCAAATTSLKFDDAMIPATAEIKSIKHNRGSVHSTAKIWAFNNGEFSSKKTDAVCNHSRGYDIIASKLVNRITGKVVDAAGIILEKHAKLYAKIGNVKAVDHTAELKKAAEGSTVLHSTLNEAFNYYIYKIADYPRNLFYWPDHENKEPDEPKTEYSAQTLTDGWAFKDHGTPKTDAERLSDEKSRIRQGRADLEEQGL